MLTERGVDGAVVRVDLDRIRLAVHRLSEDADDIHLIFRPDDQDTDDQDTDDQDTDDGGADDSGTRDACGLSLTGCRAAAPARDGRAHR